jgi:prefoldin subunit 5
MYLIEYGAGFFVECNAKDSIEFYQRKINMIKEKTVKLQ